MKTAIDNFSGLTVTFEDMSVGAKGLIEVTFPPAARGFKKMVVRLSKKQFIEQFVVSD